MKFDIVFVTFNSKKWIDGCIKSILNSDYNLKNIGLYFYDNCSNDDTIKILESYKTKYENKFNNFLVLEGKKNLGFGIGNNIAFKQTNADYVFFLNIDCELKEDTLKKLEDNICKEENKKIAVWELKQLPYEHPKYYDPVTQLTSWFSGACFVIRRDVFREVKGFDKNIFMYCEDVDLSWNIRKNGYLIKYLFDTEIIHYSYENSKFKLTQFTNSICNNIYIRYKYGSIRNILGGYKLFQSVIKSLKLNSDLKGMNINEIKKKLKRQERKMSFLGIKKIFCRIKYIFKKSNSFTPKFVGFDYEATKIGPFYQIKSEINDVPLVSIVVRTCGRPDVLKETLISLSKQTYKNFEIVIAEDGENISEKIIQEEFKNLNIKYICSHKKVGRCKIGNLALKNTSGKYINFLDDDDLFYPDHIETLVKEISSSKNKVVYSAAFETEINVISRNPYKYVIEQINNRYALKFNYLRLMIGNITPIQCVMFDREVYEKCGGFDEKMDALEDWDLWIRYALKFPFTFIERTTSLYRVPSNKKEVQKRSQFLYEPLNDIRKKYQNEIINIQVSDFYDYLGIFDDNNLPTKKSNIIKRILKKIIRRK